ncbi:restriction endonuclease subunit S [Trichocoleus sp. FACHB-262]|uniref:restriction endonuclease subunit S n=1 Tax=Trichocoleus sp. FACHB-262 TaxID=2692869 RepID=UPI00168880CB|nr:restriction endonuclease subunit S [Trichocoleus sp. FACHB-262]MBD2123603.1 restriction endonuclease subunit S [Trichocoleus sp. FACHB-262]
MNGELTELPEGWQWVNLSRLGKLINGDRGKNYPSKDAFVELGIPFINAGHLQDGVIQFSEMNYISEERFALLGSGKVQSNDILYCLRGSLGKTAIVKDNISKGAIASSLVIIRPFGCTDPEYLLQFLISPLGKAEILKFDNGSAQPNLSAKSVGEYSVPLPPLNEQKRIVAKIEELRDRHQRTKQALEVIPKLCDRFRQSVLAAAFRGNLTTDWREENPEVESASVLLEKIKEKRFELAESKRELLSVQKAYEENIDAPSDDIESLPSGWMHCRINNIGNVCNGSTPSRKEFQYWEGSIPWVSSGEVRNNQIFTTREAITQEGYESTSVRLLPIDTVLLAMIGEGKTRGQTAILKVEATINQNIAAVILNHKLISPEYLWYWFQYQYATTREAGSGSGPQALNCQRVREIPFVLAPLREQKEIVACIENLLRSIETIKQQFLITSNQIDCLNQAILAKAFRGELVEQDPNDEPAFVLLERIRAEREKADNGEKTKGKRAKQLKLEV